MRIKIGYGNLKESGLPEKAHSKAKFDMHEELCSSQQTVWSRSFLRSRSCLQTAPCSSLHLEFLKRIGKVNI